MPRGDDFWRYLLRPVPQAADTPPDPSTDPLGYVQWASDHYGSDAFWDTLTNPSLTPYVWEMTANTFPELVESAAALHPDLAPAAHQAAQVLRANLAAYQAVRQQYYEPARAWLQSESDYTRPLGEGVGPLRAIRSANDASHAGTQAVLGTLLGPSWQGQPSEWSNWPTLNIVTGDFGPATVPGLPPSQMSAVEGAVAGIGHFRDVTLGQGLHAAIEDAREQWRNAPGQIPGAHATFEHALDPATYATGRMAASANQAATGAVGAAGRGLAGAIRDLPPIPWPGR
jgi:hypothetical protein